MGLGLAAERAEPLFTMLALFGGILVAYGLLVTRHLAILWSDVRLWYYIMPAQTIILFATATFLARPSLQKALQDPGLNAGVILFLLVLLAGNVIGVIQVKSMLENGLLAHVYQFAPRLLEALKHLSDPGFTPAKDIQADTIYQLFRKIGPIHLP